MKILLSADWHLKLGQKNVPRDWQTNRYEMFFNKIYDLEKNCDIHVLAGDLYDTVPKPDEVAMMLKFVTGCGIPTYIFDGNHCATRKGKTFLTFFKDAVKEINPLVYILDGIEEHHNIDFIPYTHLRKFNPQDFNNKICCTHVRGNIPPHVIEEIDLDLFKRWDVVLAGDLHSYSNSQKNILYPGSPLSISFHRNPIQNGVLVFDTQDMSHEFIALGLPQLIRKTITSKDEIVKTNYDHTIYEITGNILELSDVDTSSDLIDKKLIHRHSDAVLNLHNLSIEEELRKYLKEVVQIEDDIDNIIKVFNDYNTGLEME